MSVNKVILVGNVGKDPEIRHLDSGVAVANFPLATSETYIAKNGDKVTTTEWHNIVLWRGLADVAEKYVTKGKQLYIEGRIRTRNYDDKDGVKRYVTEIYGDVMQLLGSKEGSASGGPATQVSQTQAPAASISEPDFEEQGGDEDLPF
ncbi:MAG: single-stranded DNA-binding protein [Bacteroidia bacterium]|nr:single-stranded DNA-binding protein [Bacteroidia bacterium]